MVTSQEMCKTILSILNISLILFILFMEETLSLWLKNKLLLFLKEFQ